MRITDFGWHNVSYGFGFQHNMDSGTQTFDGMLDHIKRSDKFHLIESDGLKSRIGKAKNLNSLNRLLEEI